MTATIVESVSQLPDPSVVGRNLFLDVETNGLLPHLGDRICGFAFTWDRTNEAWYVPMRHQERSTLFDEDTHNVDIPAAQRYLADLLRRYDRKWINHNAKFDAHFVQREEGVEVNTEIIDTLAMAKLVDLQRSRSGYELKPLAAKWLGYDTATKDEVADWIGAYGLGVDYSQVPIDIMGRYACDDVLMNRELWDEIQRRRYDGDEKVWDLEIDLTRALFQIEERGLRIDMARFQRKTQEVEDDLLRLGDSIASLGGRFARLNPSSAKQLRELIINEFGFPVLAKTDSGAASVAADTIKMYLGLEEVRSDETMLKFFNTLAEYRDRFQFHSLYLKGWRPYIDDRDILRPEYNQMVRTGRMSSKSPNIQQLSKEAKTLVIPSEEGRAFYSRDYSQVEYRIITDFCGDARTIEQYRAYPTTDYHAFVSDMCNVPRRAAKSVNFGIAFGMGEGTLIKQLVKSLDVGADLESEASRILETYHRTFPRIKTTASYAKKLARKRGWIKSAYGRRRALKYVPFDAPPSAGYDETRKAFNTAVQGTAADVMKEALVKVELYRTDMECPMPSDVDARACVHDESLFEGPADLLQTPAMDRFAEEAMCRPSIPLRVPLLIDGGFSEDCWAEAG